MPGDRHEKKGTKGQSATKIGGPAAGRGTNQKRVPGVRDSRVQVFLFFTGILESSNP
jgi:hypothetical protein